MNRGIFSRSILAMLLSGDAAMPAHAQDRPAGEPAAENREETIIVTANRREEDLQDVSGVVQAFSADRLRQDGIVELRQLQAAVPGLSITNQEGNVEIFIRGVGSANSTELCSPSCLGLSASACRL